MEDLVPQQRTTRRVPQGTAQRPAGTSPPAKRAAPHPANMPLPRQPPPAGPTNPFKEGTKKFLVAQRLIAGEVDRGKLAKEVGVSTQTIYNVVTDLRSHGYHLSIDVNSSKSPPPSPPPRPTSTPRVTQEPTRGEVSGNTIGEATPRSNSSGEVQSREKYYPGEVTQVDTSSSGRSGELTDLSQQIHLLQ